MALAINRENLEALQAVAQEFTEAWETIADAVDTWMEDADDADGKAARKEAREGIDDGIGDVADKVHDLADLFRLLPKPKK